MVGKSLEPFAHHLAFPINPNEGNALFRAPIKHVKRDGPAPVEQNDLPSGFSLRRSLRPADLSWQRFEPQRLPVASVRSLTFNAHA
jgi:hypothetical protein